MGRAGDTYTGQKNRTGIRKHGAKERAQVGGGQWDEDGTVRVECGSVRKVREERNQGRERREHARHASSEKGRQRTEVTGFAGEHMVGERNVADERKGKRTWTTGPGGSKGGKELSGWDARG